MRVLLVTGRGGVGKSTVAAATAVLAARRGSKTLLVSVGAARSVAETLGVPVGPDPTEVDTGLSAVEADAQALLVRSWPELGTHLAGVTGAGPVAAAAELTVLPGLAEWLVLRELREHLIGGRWDTVVVDGAPVAETLRLLALPDSVAWWTERLLPVHRRMLRPLLGRSGGPAEPPGRGDVLGRLTAGLGELPALLASAGTRVRLVLNPDPAATPEARRAAAQLAVHGYPVDSVVVNRVFPAGPDGWLAERRGAQEAEIGAVRAAFEDLPVRLGPYRAGAPVGLTALLELAADLYGDEDPVGPAQPAPSVQVERDGGEFVLVVAVPYVERAEVGLTRSGDELALTVAGVRRLIVLPSVLRRCVSAGAQLRGGALRIRFRPDPAQWPSQLADPGGGWQ